MIPKSSTHQYNVKTFHYSLFPFEWSNCVYHCNLYVANQDFKRWYLIYYPSHVVLLCPINLEVLEDLINFMVLKIFKSVNGNFYLFVSMKPFHFEVITSFLSHWPCQWLAYKMLPYKAYNPWKISRHNGFIWLFSPCALGIWLSMWSGA